MARKKKTNQKDKKTISTDIFGGILVVFGLVLLVLLTFDNIGVFPETINHILRGLFSHTIFIIPMVLIVLGIYTIINEKKVHVKGEIVKSFVFLAFFSSLIYTITSSDYTLFEDFVKYIVDTYNAGISGISLSGVVGGIISNLLVKIIGLVATRIILIFINLILVMYFFKISIKQLVIILYNIFVFIVNGVYDIVTTIFSKNDDEIATKDRRRLAKEQKLREIALNEKGSTDVDSKLKLDTSEQVEFDFNKLGVKSSETNIQAKQQRDEFFKKEREQKEDKNIKEVLTLDHTKLYEEQNYIFPSIDLLAKNKSKDAAIDTRSIKNTAVKLQKTLASFGVEAKVTHITKGPTVTRYELTPSTGVKVSRIVNLADDIALNLAAKSIRIEAPIPGKAAVGIEVPNGASEAVFLRDVIDSDAFKKHESKISFSLGKDASGEIIVGDIAKMPHVLIAGATGSGKSVCINSLIVSILYKSKPSDVKLILVDPKMVELSGYNGIPHLLIPVVTDPKKAAGALNWAVQEMVRRYNIFASKGVKDIKGYNKIIEQELESVKLPQIVIIIDELADLMMVAPNDVEDAICRLAQMARAAGMHLVMATQRPSVDVITGIIKANVPSRIAFTVSSQIDSRTILDMAGAEKLLGKGDMLYFPVGETKPVRIQGAYISEKEIEGIVNSIKQNNTSNYSEDIIESIEKANNKTKDTQDSETGENNSDPILNDAIDLVVDMGQASASMLQRRFKIGYSRAGRIIDQMEERGLISGYEGSKPRQVLISKLEWQELKFGNNNNTNDESIQETDNEEIV